MDDKDIYIRILEGQIKQKEHEIEVQKLGLRFLKETEYISNKIKEYGRFSKNSV